MTDPTPEASGGEAALAYFPLKTLTNLLVRMESEGVPRRLDRGYLSNMAGGTIAQFLTGLKALSLIDADERPLERLKSLVAAREQRPQVLGQLIRAQYDWAVDLGEQRATHQELEEAFRQRGPTGSTLRKAVAFYLQAATYAGLPLSPFFKMPRASGAGAASRRRPPASKRTRTDRQTPIAPSVDPITPHAEVDPVERRRDALFQVLLKKVEEGSDFDAALLDRLERIAGTMRSESD